MNRLAETRVDNILSRAREKAGELGVGVCIALVDAGAHLQAFLRMECAILGSVDVAQRKARTAVLFPGDTGDFGRLVAEEKLLGMELTNGGVVGFPGGVPVFDRGELLGAIGVSGATAEQDLEIACYAIVGAA